MAKKCTWNDIEYNSITSAAKACSIGRPAMYFRLKNGYTHDTDLKSPSQETAIPTTWEGVQYPSMSAAANANHVTAATMNRWINDGFTSFSDVKRRKRYRRNAD